MIDLANEKVVSLTEAAKSLPSLRVGRRVHVCTLYRWAQRGIRGVRLETARLGGTVVTSVEALQRFSDRCSGESTHTSEPSKQTKKRIAAAEKECAALGV